jgi:16S rRNA (cytidine1402-2'-O)-methyltransferase
MPGILYLIPTVIADDTQALQLPAAAIEAVRNTTHFLSENVRTARRFVSSLKVHEHIEALSFEVLNKDTQPEQIGGLMAPAHHGHAVGVISESGCPGIADPGALAVAYAHAHQIKVVPITGPSSILLALMASGFNGQQFAFHGYLPIDGKNASAVIRELEKESGQGQQTQIFIETPYRNDALLGHLLRTLRDDTQLCVAINLTGPGETIVSRTVIQWKKEPITIGKTPAVFLLLAAG